MSPELRPVTSSTHCCEVMVRNIEMHCTGTCVDVYDCPDTLVSFIAKYQEYGLLVHDGGTSSVAISFCPWCGQKLPASERDRWFAELERRGVDLWAEGDPAIPEEFNDHQWLLQGADDLNVRPRNATIENAEFTGFRTIDPFLVE